MSRLIRGCIVLFVISSLSLSSASAQSSTWTMTQAQLLSDVTGTKAELRSIAVAPDAKTIAWGHERQLCLYHLDSSEKTCTDAPEPFIGFDWYSDLAWSPDGKTLAFADDLFSAQKDSDIWTYDVATRSFQDRTDDHVTSRIMDTKSGDVRLLDYMPKWNLLNGDLYFFRSIRSSHSTMNLESMPLSGTEPQPIHDFSDEFPVFSVYSNVQISPDGTRMAILVRGGDPDDPLNGVWVFDLNSGALTQLMTKGDLKIGLPAWVDSKYYLLQYVQWAGNQGLVVIAEGDVGVPGLEQIASYLDIATKKITPLIDFSAVNDTHAFFSPGPEDPVSIYKVPRAGIATPDGSSYLYLGTGAAPDKGYILLQSLPPDGSAPSLIGLIDIIQVVPAASAQPAISTDGKHALLYGYWLTLQPPGA